MTNITADWRHYSAAAVLVLLVLGFVFTRQAPDPIVSESVPAGRNADTAEKSDDPRAATPSAAAPTPGP